MKTQIIPIDQLQVITQAEEFLRKGIIIAFPTDTVYGLGAMVFNPQAIEQLYAVKGREPSKAIAVLVGSTAALAQVTLEMGRIAQRLAEQFWPGPLTLVVLRHPSLPPNLSPLPTVGVRMPNHSFALELLNRVGPMAVTSANLSGRSSTNTAHEVFEQLEGRIPLILDGGRTPGGLPSTVVDCTGPEFLILRQGPLSKAQILSALS